MRDKQKERVYQAEYALRDLYDRAVKIDNPVVELDGIRLTLPPEAKFGDIEALQGYVNRVVRAQTDNLPGDHVTVRDRQTGHHAHYEPWSKTIAICTGGTRWALREIVVLHELAHHFTHTDHESALEGHGPGFVATFTQLLADTMGPEVGLAYRVLCSHSGAKETQ